MEIIYGNGRRYRLVLVNGTYTIEDTLEKMYTVSLPKKYWNIDCQAVFKETCDEWNALYYLRSNLHNDTLGGER